MPFMIKKALKWIASRFGYTVQRSDLVNDLVQKTADPSFLKIASVIEPYTILNREKLYFLWQLARQARVVPGEVGQVGVFRGGSARLLAEAFKGTSKKLYLFDTFRGMPAVLSNIDMHHKGDFSETSLEEVKKLFVALSEDPVFVPGFFPETAAPFKEKKFSFVYSDGDIYQTVKDSLLFFYPRLTKGGYMFFDDYRGKRTPGVEKALTEFLQGKPEVLIHTTLTQCFFIKQ